MKKTTYIAILAFLPLLGFGQGEVAFPDGTVFWRAYDTVAGSYHYGYTMPNQVTTTGQPNFDTLRNEMEWLALIAEMPIEFDTLPPIGDTVYVREVYKFGDRLVMARQTHQRMIYDPEQTPALFGFYRPESPDSYLDWIANEDVFLNTIRRFEGQLYTCIQAHFTLEGFTPPAAPALWRAFTPPGPECPPWQQPLGSFDAYQLGDCVTFNGQEWESTVANNVWQPGVFGWQLKE